MPLNDSIIHDLKTAFNRSILAVQETKDAIPTLWVERNKARDILHHLKTVVDHPYRTL